MTGEVSKAFGSVVDTLKATPLTLALMLVIFSLLGFMFWTQSEVLKQRAKMAEVITSFNKEIADVLGTWRPCVPQDTVMEILRRLPIQITPPALLQPPQAPQMKPPNE